MRSGGLCYFKFSSSPYSITTFHDTTFVPHQTQFSAWPIQLLSDMVRVVVLWRWGGIYSDTDVMCTRPHTLSLNAVAFESKTVIGTALLSFKSHHPTLWQLMKEMDRDILVSNASLFLVIF